MGEFIKDIFGHEIKDGDIVQQVWTFSNYFTVYLTKKREPVLLSVDITKGREEEEQAQYYVAEYPLVIIRRDGKTFNHGSFSKWKQKGVNRVFEFHDPKIKVAVDWNMVMGYMNKIEKVAYDDFSKIKIIV